MSALHEKLAAFALAPIDRAGAGNALWVMRLSFLDWASVALAGRDEPVSRILRDMALADGGAEAATVVGAGAKLPARAAAMVNGATSHALDYDDTHFAHIGHPSVAVIPAALAAGETAGAGWAEIVEAALVGVEASVRVGVWLGRSHYQTGFHQTATAGAFGAAMAAARLLGLSAAQTHQAIGIVSTRASGLKSQFGTMGKPYHAGLAAQTGVEAALLARAGFISRPDGLDCAQGFGPTHAGEGNISAFDGMGSDWLFETVAHKFHACCHGTHAAIEALTALAPGIAPGEVERVDLATHPRWMSVCNIPTPATGLEVKFSYRHTAAMALSGQNTSALQSFTDALAQDETLRALAAKVGVETDDSLPETAARVRVALSGGRVVEGAYDLDAPMPIETRQAKIRDKAAALLGGEKADALWRAISETGDLAAFLDLISE